MPYQRFARALLAAAAALGASAASAQPGEEPAPAAPAAAPCCTVPARTPVAIEITDTVNSKVNHSRDAFAFRLAEPLVIDGRIVAPAGTPGVGEVVHAARARAGGKAGELILAARYLDLNGTRIALRSLRYGRRQGVDNSGAVNTGNMVAAAVLPVASVIGYLIAGGEVNIPAGTRAEAQIAAETVLAPIE
ncbi:MAG TPA: hypothetical protein VMS43_16760 [Allosphingosinicella sp.]|nr:hypothetical protein [Allosphingosinicella sp.]